MNRPGSLALLAYAAGAAHRLLLVKILFSPPCPVRSARAGPSMDPWREKGNALGESFSHMTILEIFSFSLFSVANPFVSFMIV